MLHHSSMGVKGVDTDLPTEWEAVMCKSFLGRLFWLTMQPFFYGIRPMFTLPMKINRWQLANIFVQITFNFLVYKFWGFKSLIYFIGGSLAGTGLNPMSGHFLEHLEIVDGQETYSYYGPLNLLAYNVGYHNEHHDFPQIPGSRLPALKKIASAHYDLPYFSSWTKALVDFVIKGDANLHCRILRTNN